MVQISPKDNNYKEGFLIEGHANYAEHGQDIVCASVSILAQTAINYWRKKERVFCEHYITNGYIRVVFHVWDRSDDAGFGVLESMLDGLRAIASDYPEYVNFKEEE